MGVVSSTFIITSEVINSTTNLLICSKVTKDNNNRFERILIILNDWNYNWLLRKMCSNVVNTNVLYIGVIEITTKQTSCLRCSTCQNWLSGMRELSNFVTETTLDNIEVFRGNLDLKRNWCCYGLKISFLCVDSQRSRCRILFT
ncbi:hypothetical protein [Candidatus Hodgkinia cicadicola]|uniref:hypothetical protein n=1 Tax=Candidatus Hodgkinia cicadicola TaxID=573658 RepID=UPI0011BAC41A